MTVTPDPSPRFVDCPECDSVAVFVDTRRRGAYPAADYECLGEGCGVTAIYYEGPPQDPVYRWRFTRSPQPVIPATRPVPDWWTDTEPV